MSSTTTSDEVKAHNDSLLALGPLDPVDYPFSAIPLPSGDDAKCKLTLIRTGSADPHKYLFIHGTEPDLRFTLPAFSFLIEREQGGKVVDRVLFELGLREPSKHKHPRITMIGKAWNVKGNAGVAEILKSNNIPLDSISGVVLGHAHWDHIGNLADFPSSVSMLVGPESPLGDDLAEEMDVPLEVIKDRQVRQLNRETDKWQDIGTFRAFDYFGDGSFWAVDVPGHKLGHMAGLVRTSVNPPTYYVLASDTAHSPFLLSQPIPSKVGLWTESALNPAGDTEKLISMHHDLAQAYVSMAKMRRMDQEENVQVILAHDTSIDLLLPEGDFIPLDGTLAEISKFKSRDQTKERIFKQ